MSIISELRKDPFINSRSLAMLYVFQSPRESLLKKMDEAGIDINKGLEHVISKLSEIPTEKRNGMIMEAAESHAKLGKMFGHYLIEKIEKLEKQGSLNG